MYWSTENEAFYKFNLENYGDLQAIIYFGTNILTYTLVYLCICTFKSIKIRSLYYYSNYVPTCPNTQDNI